MNSGYSLSDQKWLAERLQGSGISQHRLSSLAYQETHGSPQLQNSPGRSPTPARSQVQHKRASPSLS